MRLNENSGCFEFSVSPAQSMRSEPFGVDRAACFEELADVFASCGALHYAKILASLKIKKGISSHKKCHFFVRGFQIMDQKRHFEPQTAILAKKWLDSFARIAGCFFCRSKNMASSPYHKDDKTKFTYLPFPLIHKCYFHPYLLCFEWQI